MKSFITTILLTVFSVSTIFSQNISGVWHGIAKTPDNKKITFVFLFEKSEKGYKTTMAVPTFNVANLKPKTTSLKEGKLLIDGADLGMKYEGIWNQNTNQFEGTYKEGGTLLKLNLVKGNPNFKTAKKPQEPSKPYPYFEEDVRFKNPKANITLSGTFTRPNKNGKFPVVVLISGSGRHDRDASAATHKPFLVLSDYLTRNGIAVLRFDDRGFGASTGNFHTATTEDFAQDVLSAVNYLKFRNDINTNKIGLIGHSEGGIIAPMVANLNNDVSFIVLLAATGVPGSEVSIMQLKTMRSFPVKDEAAFEKNVKKSHEIILSDKHIAERGKELFAHNTAYLTPILKSLGAPDANIKKFIESETQSGIRPWLRYFLKYNPALEIEKLQIPVLSLNGNKDQQVDASINQTAIKNALEKGNNKNYKVVELDGLNHMFQECKTGAINEYKDIEQTLSPKLLKIVTNWINSVTK